MNKEENAKLSKVYYKIGKLEGQVSGLEERFERFVDNDFAHLRSRFDWLFGVVILGTLITIAINLWVK